MKRPWLWIIIVAALIGLVVLAFVYPSAMVSPGALVPAHAALADKCLACHVPFRGVAVERCVTCHALAEIGVRTTLGAPIERPAGKAIRASFHQELTERDCSACHSEHGRLIQRRFSHELLRPSVRGACATCHAAPKDDVHRQITAACSECHSPERWKPSTFNHDRFFLLDRDHNATCVTCHTDNDFKRYTCMGCHEHTPANIRAEHEEEGIRDLDNCVRCHRSAHDKGREHGEGREGGEGADDD